MNVDVDITATRCTPEVRPISGRPGRYLLELTDSQPGDRARVIIFGELDELDEFTALLRELVDTALVEQRTVQQAEPVRRGLKAHGMFSVEHADGTVTEPGKGEQS